MAAVESRNGHCDSLRVPYLQQASLPGASESCTLKHSDAREASRAAPQKKVHFRLCAWVEPEARMNGTLG